MAGDDAAPQPMTSAPAAPSAAPPGQQQRQQQQQEQQQQQQQPSWEEVYMQVRDKPCRVASLRVESVGPAAAARDGGNSGGGGGGGGLAGAAAAAVGGAAAAAAAAGGAGGGSSTAASVRLVPRPLRLKREILERELDRVYEAQTLKEVHEALEEAVEALRQLESFEDITAHISSEPDDVPDACSVELVLQEMGRYSFKGGTYTQGGEYTFEGTLTARNVMGVADQWAVTGEVGTRSSRNLAASYRLPRAGGTTLTPEVRLFQTFNAQQLHCSWTEVLRGGSVALTSAASPTTALSYEYAWRNLLVGDGASRAVRSQAGDYLRAALRYTTTILGGGREAGQPLAEQGWALRTTLELGGAAPGAAPQRCLRGQAHASWALPLAGPLSLQLEGAAGLLLPAWALLAAARRGSATESAAAAAAAGGQGDCRPTPLPDRFYLGGVESGLRGFDTRGVGPSEARRAPPGSRGTSPAPGGGRGTTTPSAAAHVGPPPMRDALGGDAFASLYAALMLRLPGRAGDAGLCAHAFANGGSAVLLPWGAASVAGSSSGGGGGGGGMARAQGDHPGGGGLGGGGGGGGLLAGVGGALRRGAVDIGHSFRWSAGVGLVVPTLLGRLEANYVWVLTAREGDRLRQGFSFGFASNMGL